MLATSKQQHLPVQYRLSTFVKWCAPSKSPGRNSNKIYSPNFRLINSYSPKNRWIDCTRCYVESSYNVLNQSDQCEVSNQSDQCKVSSWHASKQIEIEPRRKKRSLINFDFEQANPSYCILVHSDNEDCENQRVGFFVRQREKVSATQKTLLQRIYHWQSQGELFGKAVRQKTLPDFVGHDSWKWRQRGKPITSPCLLLVPARHLTLFNLFIHADGWPWCPRSRRHSSGWSWSECL